MCRILLIFLLGLCLACEGDSSTKTPLESSGEDLLEEGVEEETGQETVVECVPTHEDPATWYRDIEQIFYENCQVCHADQPLYGAPMPLASFEDVTGPGWLPSDTSMVDAIMRSIEDGSMPPAGQIQLTAKEEEKLRDWAANCAPEGNIEDAVTLQSNVEPQVPPPPTDAEVIRIDANEHEVLVGQDQYMCFPMVVNFEGDKDIVRIDFDLDEAAVIHHMVLYADFDKAAEDGKPFECLQIAVEHSAFLFEWGPGGMPMHLPEGAGIEMNSGDQVILQVHYSNPQALEGLKDSSGLNLYLGEEQPNKVSMFASGPLNYNIPPFSEKSVENTCVFDQHVTLVSSTPHMHQAGRDFLTEVIRADGTVETLVKLDEWDFFHQPMYDTPVELHPGDALRTVCTLENTSALSLYAGDTTEAEMCFNFIYHTPPLGSLFCHNPEIPDLPELDIDPHPCSKEKGLVKGESLVAPDALVYGEVAPMVIGDEVLPDGPWVATKMDAYLYHFAGRLFELVDFEASKLKINFAAFIEEGHILTIEASFAIVMVPIAGGIAEGVGKGGQTVQLEYDPELSALVPSEVICQEVDDMKILYVRLNSVEERLEGTIGLERAGDGEQFTFDLVLERPSP
jgi:hypothetical protein